MTDIADLVAKLDGHDPADDLQWLSGGVDRVLADDERYIALGRMRERIDFWLEVWPELRAIVVAAQAYVEAEEVLQVLWQEYPLDVTRHDAAEELRDVKRAELLAAVRDES